ncbi:hypothetical protein [Streptomyces sp. NPDC088812]|uniref:hypothetical protein n=1 Tax=Streptomyces sp. NPDC088812 TaxID=3365905 RepID=UPI0038013E26
MTLPHQDPRHDVARRVADLLPRTTSSAVSTLPRSMAEVEAGRPDAPRDGADPLYPFGHGLDYAADV